MVEESDALKIEVKRLQERVQQERREARRDQELMNEHLKHYQGQVEELQSELAK